MKVAMKFFDKYLIGTGIFWHFETIHINITQLVIEILEITRIVRGSDYSPASELFARERQTMTGNNAKLDLVNVDAHKKIGQILTICS